MCLACQSERASVTAERSACSDKLVARFYQNGARVPDFRTQFCVLRKKRKPLESLLHVAPLIFLERRKINS